MNTELTNQGATASESNPITVTFEKSKRQYTINNGIINYAGIKSEDNVAITGINIIDFSIKPTGTQITTPTIPSGFYYVGGTINSGYVISDSSSDENKYASSEIVGNDLVGNQFVWIPVAQNQKITLKVSSNENITSLRLFDPYGDEIDVGEVSGKTYENTNIIPTINGGYRVQITTENDTKNEILPVRSLYKKSTFYEGMIQESDGNLSPDFSNLKQFIDTEDYTSSISNYGGFYFGRYEACKEDNNLVIKANKYIWNNI